MGILFKGLTLSSLIGFIVFVCVWLIINEISRKSKLMSVLVYCVLPVTLALLVSMGILGSPTGKTWFGWVKVVSALIGVYGFLLIRHTKLGPLFCVKKYKNCFTS